MDEFTKMSPAYNPSQPQYEPLGSAQVERRRVLQEELEKLEGIDREEPLIKYVTAYLRKSLTKEIESQTDPNSKGLPFPPHIVENNVQVNLSDLISLIRTHFGYMLPSLEDKHSRLTKQYPVQMSFLNDAIQILNGAKWELENRPGIEKKATDRVNYDAIVLKLKEKYGAVPE